MAVKNKAHILSTNTTTTGKKMIHKKAQTEYFHEFSPKLKSKLHIIVKRGEKTIKIHSTKILTKSITTNATKGAINAKANKN